MAVNPMMSAGVAGINAGVRGFKQAAQDVAELNHNTQEDTKAEANPREGGAERIDRVADTAEALVDLRLYQRQVQASAKVVETADALLGMLVNTGRLITKSGST